MDKLSPAERSRNMARIRSKNTSIEVMLRKALWHEGIRYRKNYSLLPGKPDIAITKYRIAVFCDGELWHGKNWDKKREAIQSNRDFWIKKIERNIERDNAVGKKLESMGWTVLRFWGEEIKKGAGACVKDIKGLIHEIEANAYPGNSRKAGCSWDYDGALAGETPTEYTASRHG